MANVEFYIGIAVQTVLFLLGGYAMVLRNDWSGKEVKIDIKEMKDELKKLTEVVTTQAVQEKEIVHLKDQVSMLQRTVEDLRRGDGWIRGGKHGLDKEYP